MRNTGVNGQLSPEYKQHLATIFDKVVQTIEQRNPSYGESWKKHGGFSAFMNLDRKWSRIETLARRYNFDVFAAIRATEGQEDGMIEGLMDLLAYAVLSLAEETDFYEGDDGALKLRVEKHRREKT